MTFVTSLRLSTKIQNNMEQREKDLLDIYERFESTKTAQGAVDFLRRNVEVVGCESVEFDLPPTSCQPVAVAVDLSLPSGLKWADRNVGAKSPEEPGLFFSWGNVEGVEIGKVCDFSEKAYAETDGSKLKGDIDPAHDAATVNMGEEWRTPSDDEFQELYDNCTWEWTSENNYYGIRFTSKINGNSIFLPASGSGNSTSWNFRGSLGIYWSSSFYSARNARFLYFYSGGVGPQSSSNRYIGFAVRAVQNIVPTNQ